MELDRFTFARAQVEDLNPALPIIREFYDHFGFAWDGPRKRAILAEVITRPDLGQLWLARDGRTIAGYALVIFHLSLEFDGRIAILDEFHVTATFRGCGLGGRMLERLAASLAAEGIRRFRLELDERHPEASRLYVRHGFTRDGRDLWSRELPGINPPASSSTCP